jgi:hypothetical protein
MAKRKPRRKKMSAEEKTKTPSAPEEKPEVEGPAVPPSAAPSQEKVEAPSQPEAPTEHPAVGPAPAGEKIEASAEAQAQLEPHQPTVAPPPAAAKEEQAETPAEPEGQPKPERLAGPAQAGRHGEALSLLFSAFLIGVGVLIEEELLLGMLLGAGIVLASEAAFGVIGGNWRPSVRTEAVQ